MQVKAVPRYDNRFKVCMFFKFFTWKQQKYVKLVVSHVSTVSNCTINHHYFIGIYVYHIYTYAYTLVTLSAKIVIFERCILLFPFFPVFLNKKFFVFQSSKKSYLKLRLPLDISFVLPLEFHQFDGKLYYVVHRT